jgi:hypothetical protein
MRIYSSPDVVVNEQKPCGSVVSSKHWERSRICEVPLAFALLPHGSLAEALPKIVARSAREWGRPMKDYQKHLEKLRTDAAECRLISDLATDRSKREMFDRLARHLTELADQVEHEMLKRKPTS